MAAKTAKTVAAKKPAKVAKVTVKDLSKKSGGSVRGGRACSATAETYGIR